MEFNGWNSFEDLARACGYTNCHKDSDNTYDKCNDNTKNEFGNIGCCDIPNGFQSLNPQLFVIIGEMLGDILSESIPFNVQIALGNWLVLVGQALLTYNSQQLYFEQGPGRCFNPRNFNVDNPLCNSTTQNANQNNSASKNGKNSDKSKERKSSGENKVDKIEELELRINQLMAEMEKIRSKMENKL